MEAKAIVDGARSYVFLICCPRAPSSSIRRTCQHKRPVTRIVMAFPGIHVLSVWQQSSNCLPLPRDSFSKVFRLLSPIRHPDICVLGSERFELRTAGLGCQVSTITFLTSIVTIFCTFFGVLVLYELFKCIRLVILSARARRGGYMVYEDGRTGIWVRRREDWGQWWPRVTGNQKEFEVEEIDDGTRQRGSSWWNARDQERRSLLE